MAKLFFVQTFGLRPGVDAREFERFWIGQYKPLGAKLGWHGNLVKGDRGAREGKYAAIWEVATVEGRDRYSPPATREWTEEALRVLGPEFKPLSDKLMSMITEWASTDYVELGPSRGIPRSS